MWAGGYAYWHPELYSNGFSSPSPSSTKQPLLPTSSPAKSHNVVGLPAIGNQVSPPISGSSSPGGTSSGSSRSSSFAAALRKLAKQAGDSPPAGSSQAPTTSPTPAAQPLNSSAGRHIPSHASPPVGTIAPTLTTSSDLRQSRPDVCRTPVEKAFRKPEKMHSSPAGSASASTSDFSRGFQPYCPSLPDDASHQSVPVPSSYASGVDLSMASYSASGYPHHFMHFDHPAMRNDDSLIRYRLLQAQAAAAAHMMPFSHMLNPLPHMVPFHNSHLPLLSSHASSMKLNDERLQREGEERRERKEREDRERREERGRKEEKERQERAERKRQQERAQQMQKASRDAHRAAKEHRRLEAPPLAHDHSDPLRNSNTIKSHLSDVLTSGGELRHVDPYRKPRIPLTREKDRQEMHEKFLKEQDQLMHERVRLNGYDYSKPLSLTTTNIYKSPEKAASKSSTPDTKPLRSTIDAHHQLMKMNGAFPLEERNGFKADIATDLSSKSVKIERIDPEPESPSAKRPRFNFEASPVKLDQEVANEVSLLEPRQAAIDALNHEPNYAQKAKFFKLLHLESVSSSRRRQLDLIRQTCRQDKERRHVQYLLRRKNLRLNKKATCAPSSSSHGSSLLAVAHPEQLSVSKQFVHDFHESVLKSTRELDCQRIVKGRSCDDVDSSGTTSSHSSSSKASVIRWPGVAVLMESYQQYLDDHRLEKQYLMDTCSKLRSENSNLNQTAEQLSLRLNSLLQKKQQAEASRLGMQASIDNLKKTLKCLR